LNTSYQPGSGTEDETKYGTAGGPWEHGEVLAAGQAGEEEYK
jgi:hypothetical protein